MKPIEMSRADKKPRSIFDLNPDIFDSCRLLRSHPSGIQTLSPPPPPPPPPLDSGDASVYGGGDGGVAEDEVLESKGTAPRWTCNTCKAEFDSLHDQRSHFKSDVHRLNVKLSIAGKDIVKEEDFYELGGDSLFEDIDVSSTSGSEDELGNGLISNSGISGSVKQKLYLNLPSGDLVSIWRCLVLNESEEVLLDNESNHKWNAGEVTYVEEGKLIGRLKYLVREPRDRTHLRTVLLASGGHFAGCVFDGNSIVAHKTFHRYVVRAKAGKRQSSKDATGKAANSAGSSLRRYNEAALKKEIQDLLVTWMPYINSSSCIFISAPSKNRQLLFNGERPPGCVIYHIPLTVRRPSLKEAKRVYDQLTHMTYEVYENAYIEGESGLHIDNEGEGKLLDEAQLDEHMKVKECSSESISGVECAPSSGENISSYPTENEVKPLHEAAKSGDAQRTLELLEQGLDPCVKDTRGRTPYTLATEKEVRNTFRRFMALNLDKWDWNAANVPSPLTKEIEESQAAKQAEKDAKRKAKAKELKKLRKAKEKAKAEEAASKNASNSDARPQAAVITAVPAPAFRLKPQFVGGSTTSKEEEQKKALAIEREKRAAAAERRLAALGIRPPATSSSSSSSLKPPMPHLTATIANSAGPGIGASDGELCSCCNASLAGKIPFHRYNYKYCSTSCMYVHKEMLDDDQ